MFKFNRTTSASVSALGIFSALALSNTSYAQCKVEDRYGGAKTLKPETKIPHLGGMHFDSYSHCSEVPDFSAETWSTRCRRIGGGKMDDKINKIDVAPGCRLFVAEHPNYQGASFEFYPGVRNDIQWTHINDISSLQCLCGGHFAPAEWGSPPLPVRN